jgi:hypothetical protein
VQASCKVLLICSAVHTQKHFVRRYNMQIMNVAHQVVEVLIQQKVHEQQHLQLHPAQCRHTAARCACQQSASQPALTCQHQRLLLQQRCHHHCKLRVHISRRQRPRSSSNERNSAVPHCCGVMP